MSATRLSAKQRDFLKAVEFSNRPVSMGIREGERSIPHYIGHDFAYDWGFFGEADARRWLLNLETRRLVTVEKQSFYRITDAGRAAIANVAEANTQSSDT